MDIGEAASATGPSPRMIRHYEKTGLTPRALRRGSSYRDDAPADVHRWRLIFDSLMVSGFAVALGSVSLTWEEGAEQ